jgi:hypothetical protein
LLDLLARLMQQIAGQQQHLAQVGSKQGEIVGGKGGKKPVDTKVLGALVGESVRTPPCAVSPSSILKCGNPRSRNVSRVIASVGTVVDVQKHISETPMNVLGSRRLRSPAMRRRRRCSARCCALICCGAHHALGGRVRAIPTCAGTLSAGTRFARVRRG